MNEKIQVKNNESLIDLYTEPLEYMTLDELSDLQERIRVVMFKKAVREAISKVNAAKKK